MNESGPGTPVKPYDVLRRQLTTSEFEPGTVLTEGVLAATFGFSRTPIREALLRLEQDGLLVRTTRGMRVPLRTVDEVTNLYEVCAVLEPEAAAIVARTHRSHDLIVLRDTLNRAVTEIDGGIDPRASFDDWHLQVWNCTRNAVLVDTLTRLSIQMSTLPARASGADSWRASHAYHVAITDSIETFDAATAAALTRDHLAASRDAAIRVLLTSAAESA